MAVVGIDQSLTGTGLAELTNDGVLKRNVLVKTGKLVGIERLDLITKTVISFCEEVDERFVISREGYSFASKGRSVFNLGELGGCIDLSLFRSTMPNLISYYVLPPTVVKKFCLGSGSVKKDSGYLLKVYNKFGKEFPDDNQADAFMIATTLLAFMKASCIQKGQLNGFDHEVYFNSLSVIEKEALLSSSMSLKDSGLTKATMKKLDHITFADFASKGLKEHLAFNRGTKT